MSKIEELLEELEHYVIENGLELTQYPIIWKKHRMEGIYGSQPMQNESSMFSLIIETEIEGVKENCFTILNEKNYTCPKKVFEGEWYSKIENVHDNSCEETTLKEWIKKVKKLKYGTK